MVLRGDVPTTDEFVSDGESGRSVSGVFIDRQRRAGEGGALTNDKNKVRPGCEHHWFGLGETYHVVDDMSGHRLDACLLISLQRVFPSLPEQRLSEHPYGP
jgi:hypothetical protein